MMSNLSKESCEACRADAPQVSDDELKELIGKLVVAQNQGPAPQ